MPDYTSRHYLGDAPSTNAPPEDFLDHSLIPSVKGLTPKKLQDIKTNADAVIYAAFGFHFSVMRGLASSGSVREEWARAAQLYYRSWQSGPYDQLADTIKSLNAADHYANIARLAGERTAAPPRTRTGPEPAPPLPSAAAPAKAGSSGWLLGVLATVAVVGGVVALRRKRRGS